MSPCTEAPFGPSMVRKTWFSQVDPPKRGRPSPARGKPLLLLSTIYLSLVTLINFHNQAVISGQARITEFKDKFNSIDEADKSTTSNDFEIAPSTSALIGNSTQANYRMETLHSSPTEPPEDSSTDHLIEYLGDNYLTSVPVVEFNLATNEPADSNEQFNFNLRSKQRRQTAQKSGDWWTKISSVQQSTKSKAPTKELATKGPNQSGARVRSDRKQPPRSNAILATRNQLSQIKSKYRQLAINSKQQLQKLDEKLIRSYKLCFKRKMPLYAGMLYRTREYLVKMAKELKQEKLVLESMTRQVQNILREKMTNRTLVREYNAIMATTQKPKFQSEPPKSSTKPVSGKTVSQKDTAPKQQPSQVPSNQKQPNILTTVGQWASTDGKRNANKEESLTTRPTYQIPSNSQSVSQNEAPTLSTQKPASKLKFIRYSVDVNEANLNKELSKSQALIDRINSSTSELDAVVDDIVVMFRLSNDLPKMKKQRLETSSTPAAMLDTRTPRTFKSPIRILFEKYGRLAVPTVPNANGSLTDVISSETKPLFEGTSLADKEPSTVDIGFDVPVN